MFIRPRSVSVPNLRDPNPRYGIPKSTQTEPSKDEESQSTEQKKSVNSNPIDQWLADVQQFEINIADEYNWFNDKILRIKHLRAPSPFVISESKTKEAKEVTEWHLRLPSPTERLKELIDVASAEMKPLHDELLKLTKTISTTLLDRPDRDAAFISACEAAKKLLSRAKRFANDIEKFILECVSGEAVMTFLLKKFGMTELNTEDQKRLFDLKLFDYVQAGQERANEIMAKILADAQKTQKTIDLRWTQHVFQHELAEPDSPIPMPQL